MTCKAATFALVAGLATVSLSVNAQTPFGATTNPDHGTFLIVTDIHFDPFKVPDIVPKLDQALVSDWPAIFTAAGVDDFQTYGTDAGYPLTASALKLASGLGLDFDYVLYTGDYLSHDFAFDYNRLAGKDNNGLNSFSVKTAQYVSDAITVALPDIPVFGVMGNTDSVCGDYLIAPESPFTAGIREQWQKLAQQTEPFEAFDVGGFYKAAHPTVKDHDIIVLNDIFWSTKYQDNCNSDGGDPGQAMMAWLEWQLYQSKLQARKAHLLLHIPPGINAYSTSHGLGSCGSGITPFWNQDYARQFDALMAEYADVVDYSFSGHTHMDSFVVINDAQGRPNVAGHITPAVSPIFGNNPSLTAYLYDRSTGDVLDAATWYLSNLLQAHEGAAPDWQLEYVFREVYGTPDMSAASLARVSSQIMAIPSFQRSFIRYYAASTDGTNPVNDTNLKAFVCSQTAVSVETYKTCYCSQ